MEYCNQCKINEAEIKCNKCKKNYFKICDYYLHIIMKEDIHNNNTLQKIDNLPALQKHKYEDIISYDININYENKNKKKVKKIILKKLIKKIGIIVIIKKNVILILQTKQ